MTLQLIPVNSGTTLTLNMRWKTSAGNPVDLTGAVLDGAQLHASLEGKLSFTVVDAVNGLVRVRLNQATPLARGDYTWRARRTPAGGDPTTTNLIAFRVQ